MVHATFWYYGDLEPLKGGDAETGVKSPLECCKRCDEHPKCFRWSYGLAGQLKSTCMLKTEYGGYADHRAHFISGKSSLRKIGRGGSGGGDL